MSFKSSDVLNVFGIVWSHTLLKSCSLSSNRPFWDPYSCWPWYDIGRYVGYELLHYMLEGNSSIFFLAVRKFVSNQPGQLLGGLFCNPMICRSCGQVRWLNIMPHSVFDWYFRFEIWLPWILILLEFIDQCYFQVLFRIRIDGMANNVAVSFRLQATARIPTFSSR